jgi:hypothetical protein
MGESLTESGSAGVWRVIELQIIAFPVDTPPTHDKGWWRTVASADPSETVRKPGQNSDVGVIEGWRLMVSTDVARTFWLAVPNVTELPESLPNLGTFREASDRFVKYISKWFSGQLPSMKRLAFAAKLVQQVPDAKAVAELLAQYLPKTHVPDDPADFIYRINRKITSSSTVPHLLVNQLATWSSATLTLQFQTQPVGGVPQLSTKVLGEAIQLELDINTAQDRHIALPQSKLTGLIQELHQYAVRISNEGDKS